MHLIVATCGPSAIYWEYYYHTLTTIISFMCMAIYSIITELELFCPETAKSTDENGDTPLHLACSYGFMEVAERLIKGGADIEARYWS